MRLNNLECQDEKEIIATGFHYAKSAFIYATVLEGATRSQTNDGPVTAYEAGQSFSEQPGDRHGISANASKTKPAKLRDVSDEMTNAHGPIARAGLQSMRPGPPEKARRR
jgi:hypothetical protein